MGFSGSVNGTTKNPGFWDFDYGTHGKNTCRNMPGGGGGGGYSPNKVDGGVPLKWVTFFAKKKKKNP